MSESVGFIGIGTMGQPMSERLLEAGFPLTVCDRIKSRTDRLAERGARVAGSPREVAAQSDVTITMTPDGPSLRAVALGENGALAGARPGSILINMSTVDIESSAEVAGAAGERGVKFLRAPVSGSTVLASQGKLTIMVSGDKQVYERCQGIFGVLGQKVFHLGAGDEALYFKLMLNMMIGAALQGMAEALAFGEKAGLSWEQMLELTGSSVVASPLVAYKIGPLSKRDFSPAFSVSLMAKDFDIALDAGKKLRVPMPTIGLVRQFFGALQATDRGDLDVTALLLLMEDYSGVKH